MFVCCLFALVCLLFASSCCLFEVLLVFVSLDGVVTLCLFQCLLFFFAIVMCVRFWFCLLLFGCFSLYVYCLRSIVFDVCAFVFRFCVWSCVGALFFEHVSFYTIMFVVCLCV